MRTTLAFFIMLATISLAATATATDLSEDFEGSDPLRNWDMPYSQAVLETSNPIEGDRSVRFDVFPNNDDLPTVICKQKPGDGFPPATVDAAIWADLGPLTLASGHTFDLMTAFDGNAAGPVAFRLEVIGRENSPRVRLTAADGSGTSSTGWIPLDAATPMPAWPAHFRVVWTSSDQPPYVGGATLWVSQPGKDASASLTGIDTTGLIPDYFQFGFGDPTTQPGSSGYLLGDLVLVTSSP